MENTGKTPGLVKPGSMRSLGGYRIKRVGKHLWSEKGLGIFRIYSYAGAKAKELPCLTF